MASGKNEKEESIVQFLISSALQASFFDGIKFHETFSPHFS